MKTAKDLRNYQRYFSDQILKKPGVMLAVGMSLGKTGAVLHACQRMIDMEDVNRVLVVAPLRVARLAWPDEINKWEFSAGLTWRVIEGTEAERRAQLKNLPEITLINRENIVWLVRHYRGKKWPFEMVVYDESSRMKSGKKRTANKTFSEFGALCSIRKHTKKVVEMSGTNAPNGLIDLWGQIYFLDLGQRLGAKKSQFLSRWFDPDGYMGRSYKPKPNAFKEITARIKDIVLGLRPGDYVELPKEVYSNHYVEMPKAAAKEYKRFERELVSEKYDVEAVSRGVLTQKLLQFANGSMYRNLDDGRRKVVRIHDEKLHALESIIKENSAENILVAYSFNFDKKAIKKKFPHAVIFDEDPKAYQKWNAGKIKLLLAHPASIGHGMNMQFGGHWLVWYGMTWSLELYQQMNKRLPRPGQASPTVFIRHILTRGTKDEEVLALLNTRGITQDKINDRVQIDLAKLDKVSTRS